MQGPLTLPSWSLLFKNIISCIKKKVSKNFVFCALCICAKLLQSCLTLCGPMDCGPSGFPVHEILQARILEWVAKSSSKVIFLTQGSNPCLLWLLTCRWILYLLNHWGSISVSVLCCASSLSHVQLFVTPWTVDCQDPLSMGILQARILEWVAMPSSRGSSQPRDQTQVSLIADKFFTI